MALFRNPLSRAVQAGGAISTAALTLVVWFFLSGAVDWPVEYQLAAFALLCLLIISIALSWLERTIIQPLAAVNEGTYRGFTHLLSFGVSVAIDGLFGPPRPIHYALSNNIGLGGHNGAVIFKRYDGD